MRRGPPCWRENYRYFCLNCLRYGARSASNVTTISEIGKLLARARKSGTPVIHVVHKGYGALFDPSPGFEIVASLRPQSNEIIVEKSRVSVFAGTTLSKKPFSTRIARTSSSSGS